MRYTNLILVLLFINTTLAIAQPGFLGKTLSITYNFNTSPVLNGVNYNGNQNPFTTYNGLHSIRIDKVNSRKGSIGLVLGYNRSSLYDMGYLTPDIYRTYNNNGYPYKLSSYKAGVNFRTYFSGDANLAPFGQYFEFEIGANLNQTIDAVVEDVISNKIVPYISMAFGTQRIYNKRYIFDFSMRLSIYPSFLSNIYTSETYENSYYYYGYSTPPPAVSHDEFVEIINKNAITRLQLLDLITFKVGVGALIK